MKNRFVLGTLAAVITAALLAGCGSTPASQQETTAAETTVSETKEAATEAAQAEQTTAEETTTEAESEVEVRTIYASTKGYPSPYMIIDEDNNLSGYDIEVLQEVFNRLPQYDLEFVIAEGDAVLTGLNSGLYDLAVNNYGYNEERSKSYYFSYPYDKSVFYFVQRPDDEPLKSFQDAADRGYKYEAASGNSATTALERWNDEHPDSQIELEYSESEIAIMFEHVEDGLFDFRVHEAPIYERFKSEFGFDLVGYPIDPQEVHDVITSADCTYFIFPMTDEGGALRDEVNEKIYELWQEGVLAELGEKYFGIDQSPTQEDFDFEIN